MSPMDRRGFLTGVAATGVGVWLGTESETAEAQAAAEKVSLAVIGLGGQGGANLKAVASQNIVALCDVDDDRAGKAYEQFPDAKKYTDYRKMLDEIGNRVDGVVISTPDHSHFHPAYYSMQLGKAVYLEKPMAHTVWEVRQLTKLAAEKRVATQLGVQRHTLSALHKAVELVQSGAIGTVKEVHSWIGGGRGMYPLPTDNPPTPATIQWDLWIGPGKEHAYTPELAPYKWRFWWDYGTGEAGNWGCHILDIPYWALNLKYPTRVTHSVGTPDAIRTPKEMSATYEFPAVGDRPALTLHWYHGTPPILKELNLNEKGMNNLFIGSKGMLLCGFDKTQLLPEDRFKEFKEPAPLLPKSPGFHKEWFAAIKGGKPATCEFGYTGPMTETVLLGNVAYRAQESFDWDADTLKAKGSRKVEAYLRPSFRKGWEIKSNTPR